jgi:hypothetical protein
MTDHHAKHYFRRKHDFKQRAIEWLTCVAVCLIFALLAFSKGYK